MLIIPLEKSINWRKPPIVTFLLIIINTIVLIFTNAQNEKMVNAPLYYYVTSILPTIELPRYIETQSAAIVDNLNNKELIDKINNKQATEEIIVHVLMAMENNATFMKKLHEDKIITQQDAVYNQ